MNIKNLTQHPPSAGQDGVSAVDPCVLTLLNFFSMPKGEEIVVRAASLAALAAGYESAMVGGAPYLMPALVAALKKSGVNPLFAFTERKSVEETMPDGSVKKTSVFAHAGWVTL